MPGEKARAVSAAYAGCRIAQPSINRPMAAIQLPATRTVTRVQRTRTEAACPAKSDSKTKSATMTTTPTIWPEVVSLRVQPGRRLKLS